MHRGILFYQSDDIPELRGTRVLPTWQYIPSWSWASLDKPVTWYDRVRHQKLTHCTSIDVVQHTETPRLQLSGILLICPARYSLGQIADNAHRLDGLFVGLDEGDFKFEFSPDQWFATTIEEYTSSIVSTSASHPHHTTQDTRSFLESIVIAPITCCIAPLLGEDGVQVGNVMCLLLYALPGAQNGVYVRAGIVVATKFFYSEVEVDSNMVKAQFEAYRRPVARNLFQEEDDHGNYTVTVI